jgi:hypothetical protein
MSKSLQKINNAFDQIVGTDHQLVIEYTENGKPGIKKIIISMSKSDFDRHPKQNQLEKHPMNTIVNISSYVTNEKYNKVKSITTRSANGKIIIKKY